MRRTLAIIAVLALGMPLLSLAWLPPAGGITIPERMLVHSGSVVLDNFTGMQMTDVSLSEGGPVMLAKANRFWGTPFQMTNIDPDIGGYAFAGGANNAFVVAWTYPVGTGQSTQHDIQFQLVNNRGEMIGAARPACTDTSDQDHPVVAMAPDGHFIVAWLDHRGGGLGIYAQLFEAGGNKLGNELIVTSAAGGKESLTAAASPRGGYILAWTDTRTGTYQIFADILDKDGKSVSGDIQVTAGTDYVNFPSIGVDSQGRSMLVYSVYRTTPPNHDIAGQRLDASGQKLGGTLSIVGGTSDKSSPHACTGPADTMLVVWTDDRNSKTTDWDLYGQKFDAAGSKVGGEMLLCNDSGSQSHPMAAYDSDGNLMVAWWQNTGSDYKINARYFPSSGIGRVKTVEATVNPSDYHEAIGLAAGERGDFLVAYDQVSNTGSSYPRRAVARAFLVGNELSGTVTTSVVPAPAGLYRWESLSADVSLASSSANSVSFEYSTDGGLNWTALPANNSLAAAGVLPLAIRARLSTLDNLTTPVLRGITLRYIHNYPPTVKLPPDMTVKKNADVTILSNVTDGDFLDQFGVTYKWTQTAGKNLTLVNATGQNLSFKADKAGTFTFRLVVNDGYNDSAPATITVKVTESKPAAKSGFEWVMVLGAAVGIAAIIRRRRT